MSCQPPALRTNLPYWRGNQIAATVGLLALRTAMVHDVVLHVIFDVVLSVA
jgi:hypothetical protein